MNIKYLRCINQFVLCALIGSTSAIANDDTASNPYSETIRPKWSYFQHSDTDRTALNAVPATRWGTSGSSNSVELSGGIEAHEHNYIQLTGAGKMVSGLQPGDYLQIRVGGTVAIDGNSTASVFEGAGVMVDRTTLRSRYGWSNRFDGVAQTMPCVSSDLYNSFVAKNSQSGRNTDAPYDFSLGMSNSQGVIVKVPYPPFSSYPNVYLFTSVNSNIFNTNSTSAAAITLTKLDPAVGRPMLSVGNVEVNEGGGAFRIPISRSYRGEFLTRVSWSIQNYVADDFVGSNGNAGSIPTSGVIVMQPNENTGYTPWIPMYNDNIYEGNETFTITLTTDNSNNPNHAYVGGSGTFNISIIDDDPVPTVSYSSPLISGNPASVTTEGLSAEVPLKLSHPSKNAIKVWFAVDAGTVTTCSPSDYTISVSPNNYIEVPAGQISGIIPITITNDTIYEGIEKIVLGLGVEAGKAIYNGGKHHLTVTDDDLPPIASIALFNPAQTSTSEPTNGSGNGGPINVNISLGGSTSAFDTTIPLQFSGTAVKGTDFTAPSQVIIPAGQSSAIFSLLFVDDTLPEYEEIIICEISAGTHFSVSSSKQVQIRVVDNDGGSEQDQILPTTPFVAGTSAIQMNLDNILPIATWRIKGEPLWRMSGSSATGLTPGFHEIEFREIDGYLPPSPMIVETIANTTWSPTISEVPFYIQIDAEAPGTSLTVNLTGDEGLGGWKLEGENDWRSGGSIFTNFPRGVYRIFYKPLAGRLLPKESIINLRNSPVRTINTTYIAGNQSSTFPASLGNADVNNNGAESTVFCGRVSSSAGFGSGSAAQVNTVLTCAHVLFDDNTLSFATDVRWHHQAHGGYHQDGTQTQAELTGVLNAAGVRSYSSTIIPKGFLVMTNYAQQRNDDMSDGAQPGYGSAASNNLDVGVMYFSQPVARGAKVGIVTVGNGVAIDQWIRAGENNSAAPVSKRLVGYPYNNIPYHDQGRLHRRTYSLANGNYSTFTVIHDHDFIFRCANVAPGAGMSGAPFFVERTQNEWNQCAIYIGTNSSQNYGIFRVIDSEVVGMITQAQALSQGSGNSTGGGSFTGNSVADLGLNKGRIFMRSNVTNASWRPSGAKSYKRARVENQTGDYIDMPLNAFTPVEFAEIAGWIRPSVMTVVARTSGEWEYSANYLPENFDTISEMIDELDGEVNLHGSNQDYDQDGVDNLLEFAFGLDPIHSDAQTLEVGDGVKGLPSISTIGNGSARRLRVVYVRLKSEFGLTYQVEFCSSLCFDANVGNGSPPLVIPLNDNWEKVIVEDDLFDAPPSRFVRVKVTQDE